ncbi:glycosyl transferase family 90 [Methylorubrum extorquens]
MIPPAPTFRELTTLYLTEEIRRWGWVIGPHTYGLPRVLEPGLATLSIGAFCSIGPNVTIVLGNHRTDLITTYPFRAISDITGGCLWENADHCSEPDHESRGNVVIGHEVWLGANSVVLSGVTIGHGAIIGAGSVVSRDIPPYAVAVGNPAAVKRFRFDEATIAQMLDTNWWTWTEAQVDKALPYILSSDTKQFLAYAATVAQADVETPSVESTDDVADGAFDNSTVERNLQSKQYQISKDAINLRRGNMQTLTHQDRLAVIRSWVDLQLSGFSDRTYSKSAAFEYFNHLNRSNGDIFILKVREGRADLAEKPQEGRHVHYEQALARAQRYHSFLWSVAARFASQIDATIAVHVGDGAFESEDAPVFSFQKRRGQRCPLLPDIDLIRVDFLTAPEFADNTPYTAKSNSAIFAGVTSGYEISPRTIIANEVPRIRAGLYFRRSPNIHFRIPKIVDCDSPEARSFLEGLGFGDGNIVSWQEQLKHKFMLSMDGNGPSPARIAVGLQSNCALIQYASEHVLYYTDSLLAGAHYLSVTRDCEVETIIANEGAEPGHYADVARLGSEFVSNFLSHDMVMHYGNEMMRSYAELFV